MIPAKRKSIVKLKFKCLSASWQKLCQCVNLTDPGGHSASLSYINNNMKKSGGITSKSVRGTVGFRNH